MSDSSDLIEAMKRALERPAQLSPGFKMALNYGVAKRLCAEWGWTEEEFEAFWKANAIDAGGLLEE